MGTTLRLGDWGELRLLGAGDPVPESLLPARGLWEHHPRRLPALLTFARTGEEAAYVVCWPDVEAVPDPDGDVSLRGAAVAEVTVLRCEACGASHDALYPVSGLPGFGIAGHHLLSGCPTCGARYRPTGIQALAIGPGRDRPAGPPSGTRPALLAGSLIAYLFVALSLGFGYDDGTALFTLGITSLGLAWLVPPVFAVYTRRAFRWVVGTYAVLTFLGLFGGGILLVPSVLCLVFAAIAPPPRRPWRMGPGMKAFCAASLLVYVLGVLTLAVVR